jgi:hypothetical protein
MLAHARIYAPALPLVATAIVATIAAVFFRKFNRGMHQSVPSDIAKNSRMNSAGTQQPAS